MVLLGSVPVSPRQFWKDHEHEFPTLARIARDLFSIPATGAGVERLFNSARDTYHYRRGRLNSTTIQDLMMFTYTTRFKIEDEQLAFIQSLSIHEEGESDEPSKQIEGFELISDTEEDKVDEEDKADEEVSRLSAIRAGKRRQSVLSRVLILPPPPILLPPPLCSYHPPFAPTTPPSFLNSLSLINY